MCACIYEICRVFASAGEGVWMGCPEPNLRYAPVSFVLGPWLKFYHVLRQASHEHCLSQPSRVYVVCFIYLTFIYTYTYPIYTYITYIYITHIYIPWTLPIPTVASLCGTFDEFHIYTQHTYTITYTLPIHIPLTLPIPIVAKLCSMFDICLFVRVRLCTYLHIYSIYISHKHIYI